jgi:hypothetical protein
VIKHVRIPWTGTPEEFEKWVMDPDEGIYGSHGDEP